MVAEHEDLERLRIAGTREFGRGPVGIGVGGKIVRRVAIARGMSGVRVQARRETTRP